MISQLIQTESTNAKINRNFFNKIANPNNNDANNNDENTNINKNINNKTKIK